jgi:hypothetical protein
LSDCNNALQENPNFSKAYKRMFKCYMAKGEVEVTHIFNGVERKRSE